MSGAEWGAQDVGYGGRSGRDTMQQRGGGVSGYAPQSTGHSVNLNLHERQAEEYSNNKPQTSSYGYMSAAPTHAAPIQRYTGGQNEPMESVHTEHHYDALEEKIIGTSTQALLQLTTAFAVAGAVLILLLMGSVGFVLCFVHVTCTYGVFYAVYLAKNILEGDKGDEKMQDVASAIRDAATGFLTIQYGAIAKMACGVGGVLFLAYFMREKTPGVDINSFVLAVVTAVSFLIGSFCSALAGYVGVWISVRANLRVAAQAVLGSVDGALKMSFHGGAFSAIISACMCMIGLSLLYSMFHFVAVTCYGVKMTAVPLLLVGYGFGASFVALFMQVAGGIYTKAADVGADMVGKIDKDIPEDDPRNPAVIADLVGDNVGDCAGSMADVFESIAAEILGTMILAGSLSHETGLDAATTQSYIFFPLVIHALDVVVSSAGISIVKYRPSDSSPLSAMKRGYLLTAFLATILFTIVCRVMLATETSPNAWWRYWCCGMVGIFTAFVLLFVCQYYTDYAYPPVRGIAAASETGHGTNVIQGLAVGFESTGLPAVVISINLATAYYLGEGAFPTAPITSGLFVCVFSFQFKPPLNPIDTTGNCCRNDGHSVHGCVHSVDEQLRAYCRQRWWYCGDERPERGCARDDGLARRHRQRHEGGNEGLLRGRVGDGVLPSLPCVHGRRCCVLGGEV